ncbi:hypothetical protein E1263_09320 [Kribbella antibiotica]|uniref:Uncharacterized protein n=1 Tax=Kribbella antibiotica TaxID=190195 RepID=A0A4R4ZSA3_9ACTN|nr:hypothetical protein [Kribbella antibiotica]TDD60984.1 hypothetical protein E1263_09320 [Kribbella antibiotica]
MTSHRRKKKPERSRTAVGAAIVATAAIAGVSAFILTQGGSKPSTADSVRAAAVPEKAATTPTPSAHPTVASKADRKPPANHTVAKPTTSAPIDTGPTSPVFKRGQWIAVLDKYTSDTGLDASQTAQKAAAKIAAAGVPAKAMLVNGQYPGFANSSGEPVLDTWVVYLGPGPSSAQMLDLCSAPKTQRAYSNLACPTYEPAG